jgi:hypothetical protein
MSKYVPGASAVFDTIFPGAGSVGGATASAVSNLTTPPTVPAPPPLAPAPVVQPPPLMPLPDDKALQMQQRKSIAQLVKSRGRASTILTSDGSLGTPPEALGG